MSNLTTRKIVLGLLMVLVLAFSVQGMADALTFGTTRTGDLQTVLTDQDFSITFRPDLLGAVDENDFFTPSKARHQRANAAALAEGATTSTNKTYNSKSLVITEMGFIPGTTTHYYFGDRIAVDDGNDGTTDRYTQDRNWVTEADAYYYNTEQVTIGVPGGTLKKVGRYDAPSDGVLMETGKDGSKLLDSSMTLTFTAPDPGAELIITIRDTTTGDYPTGVTPANPLTFTVYVVPGTSPNATLEVTAANAVKTGNAFGAQQIDEFFGVTQNVPLTYEVEGSGRVFVEESTDRENPRG